MSSYAIWLDSKEAKVFKYSDSGKDYKHLQAHGHKHHSEAHGKHNDSHHAEATSLFKDVSEYVKDAKEILILGPGEAKNHFRTHLDKHFAHTLAKCVVGVETSDHPTDNQILAQARKFFKRSDLY